jgi:hypothetical protein
MDVCIPNIGAREQRRRLVGGRVGLAVAVAFGAALAAADAPLLLRALIAVPLYGAALGFLQHREKT